MTDLLQLTINVPKSHRQPQCTTTRQNTTCVNGKLPSKLGYFFDHHVHRTSQPETFSSEVCPVAQAATGN